MFPVRLFNTLKVRLKSQGNPPAPIEAQWNGNRVQRLAYSSFTESRKGHNSPLSVPLINACRNSLLAIVRWRCIQSLISLSLGVAKVSSAQYAGPGICRKTGSIW